MQISIRYGGLKKGTPSIPLAHTSLYRRSGHPKSGTMQATGPLVIGTVSSKSGPAARTTGMESKQHLEVRSVLRSSVVSILNKAATIDTLTLPFL